MPVIVPLLVGGAVATGTAAAIGTAIVGTAVSTAVATGIGAAVVGTGAALATGQKPEDALKTGVISGLTAGVGPSIGAAVAPTASVGVQQALGGAILGGGTAAISGGDPLKGAITGAIASITTSSYSSDVGYALGATTDTTAKVIGNATINAGLSGLQAAATGGDISKAMLAGAVTGGIMADPSAVANALVGGESNLQSLISGTNITLEQAQNIISTAAGNAVVAELRGSNFGDELRDGLIAGGISTSVANAIGKSVDSSVSPEARNAIFAGTKGITDTAVRAGLNNENIGDALTAAAPNILISTVLEYQNTQAEIKKRQEAEDKLTGLDSNQKILLAQVPTDTLSDAVEAIPTQWLQEIIVTASKDDVADKVELATTFWDRIKQNFSKAARPEASTVALLTGVVGGTKSLYGFFGGGTTGLFGANMAALDRIERRLQDFLTAEAIGDRDLAYQIMKQAEGEGVWAEVKAGAQAFMQRPFLASLEAAGSILPQVLTAAVTAPASVLGRLTALGTTGAMMGVGETKNEIFREVYTAARGRGLDDVDAIELATRASAYTGPAADQQALAAFIGAVTSVGPLAGLERALVRDIGADTAARVATRATAAALVEKLTETGQAFQQNVASNVAINRLQDPASAESQLLGDWTDASRAYREFIFENPWIRDTFEGATASSVYEGLSSAASAAGLSAGVDLSARARTQAESLGVEWELLDSETRANLTIRSLNPSDIIDVVARDVTPLPAALPYVTENETVQQDIKNLENDLQNTPQQIEVNGVTVPNPRYFLLQDQISQRKQGFTPTGPILSLAPPIDLPPAGTIATGPTPEQIAAADNRRTQIQDSSTKNADNIQQTIISNDDRIRDAREEQRILIAEERAGLVSKAEDQQFLKDLNMFNTTLNNIGREILTAQDQIGLIDLNLQNLQLERRDLLVSGGLTGNTNALLMGRRNQLLDLRDSLVKRQNALETEQKLATPPEKRVLTDKEVVDLLGLSERDVFRYNFDLNAPGGGVPGGPEGVTPGSSPESIFGFSPDVVLPDGTIVRAPFLEGREDQSLTETGLPAELFEELPLKPVSFEEAPSGEMSLFEANYPFDPLNPDELWLGGKFLPTPEPTGVLPNLPRIETPQMQEQKVTSALQRASGVDSRYPETFFTPSYYSYGRETSPVESLKFFKKGGTTQTPTSDDKIPMSPLLMAGGDSVSHKGAHHVQGAGGGQDDLIPAQLADGEYVFDAEIVAALGDGSNKEGAKILDKFREEIRRHKRGGSTKSIPPKAKSPLAYLRSALS